MCEERVIRGPTFNLTFFRINYQYFIWRVPQTLNCADCIIKGLNALRDNMDGKYWYIDIETNGIHFANNLKSVFLKWN